jgi:selenocysteine-specific elongation factor
MPVVGTAGHVDHGKSTLVRALTGRDPDRWEEEKRRGLTIDLGFAWTTLTDGTEISFVDVPGHERFIKNMLAGSEAIDVALFVVAADEGWMPQSEEHLAVLNLLGVRSGVVAVTKADRVDDELMEFVTLEVEEKLAGTSLAGSPIIGVSPVSGRGIDELRMALEVAVREIGPSLVDIGRPRLWVDRSFTITGAGTVVTGTLLDGPLAAGDLLEIWPGRLHGRVRGLQSHEQDHPRITPHNRVAVNLVGLERAEVTRGAMLGRPDDWQPTETVLVQVDTARYLEEPLTNRGAYHLHLGSGAWPVRMRLVQGAELGGSGPAILQLSHPLPLKVGDRFILREVGRRAVVGGGRVLDPHPMARISEVLPTVEKLRKVVASPADDQAAALLQVRGQDSLARLSADSGGGIPVGAVIVGSLALSEDSAAGLSTEAVKTVRAFHSGNPLRPGIPKASLASRLEVDQALVEALVASSPGLRDDGATVAAEGFGGTLSSSQEAAWETLRATLVASGLAVPRIKEVGIDTELLHALVRQDRVVRIGDELVYLPEQIDEIIRRLGELPDRFTVADFRDTFGFSRKYAVPLLEYLDSRHVTMREGDLRSVRNTS